MLRRFKPYFKYLRPVSRILAGAILCGLVYGAATGLGLPLMQHYIFPRVFDPSFPPLPGWQILAVAMWLPIVFTLRGLAGYLNSYLIQIAGVRILEAIRLDYFRKLQVLPLAFLQRQTTGDIISRGLADTNQLQTTLTTIANDGMKQPATLLFAVGSIVYVTARQEGVGLMLASLAIIPMCVFPIRYVGKRVVKRAYQMQTQMGSVTNSLSENLGAAKEVRAFGLEERQAGGVRGRDLRAHQRPDQGREVRPGPHPGDRDPLGLRHGDRLRLRLPGPREVRGLPHHHHGASTSATTRSRSWAPSTTR